MTLATVARPIGIVVMLALSASCGRRAPAGRPGSDASVEAASPEAPVSKPGSDAQEDSPSKPGNDAPEDSPAIDPADGSASIDDGGSVVSGSVNGDAATGLCVGSGWCWGNTTLQGNALAAVWGSGPKDVWAVGDGGTILHWNGEAWTQSPSGTTTNLKSVWGAASNDVWAVGDGAFLHWNGTSWSGGPYEIRDMSPGGPSPPFSSREAPVRRVWGTASNDVWAVTGESSTLSGRDLILHWDGLAWFVLGVDGDFSGVWGSSRNDVYAAGNDSRVLHWDGKKWELLVNFEAGFISGGPMWGTGRDDVWMAAQGEGLILHRNAQGWSWMGCGATPCPRMLDVWGTAANDVWTVGKGGAIYHWNGTAWSARESATTQDLAGVWGSSASDVWAVGAAGTIQHWNGTSWSGPPGRTGNVRLLSSVWGGGGELWAVGRSERDAYAVRWDGQSWSETLVVPSTTDPALGPTTNVLSSVWGSGPTDIWAVGSEGFNDSIQHWDGAKWTSFSTGMPPALTSVWGSGSADAWAVGGNGGGAKILHWDGTRWSPFATGLGFLQRLTAVWSSGPKDVWALGIAGAILHFDGAKWTRSVPDPTLAFNAAWGSGPTNVWAVGTREPARPGEPMIGAILHWNGQAWSPMTSLQPLPQLFAVSGSSATNVYAVGGNGMTNANVVRWNGQAWSPLAGLTNKALRGAWVSRMGDAFMVGDFGGILHR